MDTGVKRLKEVPPTSSSWYLPRTKGYMKTEFKFTLSSLP